MSEHTSRTALDWRMSAAFLAIAAWLGVCATVVVSKLTGADPILVWAGAFVFWVVALAVKIQIVRSGNDR